VDLLHRPCECHSLPQEANSTSTLWFKASYRNWIHRRAMDIHADSGPSSRGKEVAKACHMIEREEIEAMATTLGRPS